MKYERLTNKNEKWEYSFVEDEDVYIRLQELEDKIENGTLIELPRIIHPNREEWHVQYQYKSGVIDYHICFSQEEAEAKLKELQQ